MTNQKETWQDRFKKQFSGSLNTYLIHFIQSEIDSAVNIALSKHREKVKEKIKELEGINRLTKDEALTVIKNII